jgi:uncharacterized protein (DUF433 family)
LRTSSPARRRWPKVIERTLHDVEFDDMQPLLWRPRGRAGGVLLDPHRSFGTPIEEETSIPTSALAEAVEAEGSVAAVARLYEIDRRAVDRAVRFETWQGAGNALPMRDRSP